MFSLSQSLPGPGKRALRTSMAESDVDVAKAQLDQVRLDVRIRVRKAFDDMLRAQDKCDFTISMWPSPTRPSKRHA